jgi:predicted nucleotidyltransferase
MEIPPLQHADPYSIARDIALQFSKLDLVDAITLGGSLATGKANANSDIDLYVYSSEPVSLDARVQIIEPRSSQRELDAPYWETEDYWLEKESGIKVEVIYRSHWPLEALQDMFANNRAHMGFSTSIWHNIVTSKVLFDRKGWYASLQKIADVPYPDSLANAIIGKNFSLLRGSLAAHPKQLALAIDRNDMVHAYHRIDMILASYFDILFALNRTLHPGDKRMLAYAADLKYTSKGMHDDVTRLVTSNNWKSVKATVDQLIDRLELLLKNHDSI